MLYKIEVSYVLLDFFLLVKVIVMARLSKLEWKSDFFIE